MEIPFEVVVILAAGIPPAGVWLYGKGQEKAEKDRAERERRDAEWEAMSTEERESILRRRDAEREQ